MDSGLLWWGLAALYVVPTVIVLVRRPTMPFLIITLDLLLGLTIVGWVAALVLSLAFPRRRDVRSAVTTVEAPASTLPDGGGADARSADFLRDPLTVGILTGVASTAYYLWWLWHFFKMAGRERFPRARSFWSILLPIYGLAVMFRMFEDLENRLTPQARARFSARTVLA